MVSAPPSRSRQSLRLRWYSLSDAAGLLGLSEAEIGERVAAGTLTAVSSEAGLRVLLAPEALRPVPALDVPLPPDHLDLLQETADALRRRVAELERHGVSEAVSYRCGQ